MTLPSCVGFPGASASCRKTSAFPTGAPQAPAGPSGPFCLTEGKQLNDKTLVRNTLPDAPVWGQPLVQGKQETSKTDAFVPHILLSSILCQVLFQELEIKISPFMNLHSSGKTKICNQTSKCYQELEQSKGQRVTKGQKFGGCGSYAKIQGESILGRRRASTKALCSKGVLCVCVCIEKGQFSWCPMNGGRVEGNEVREVSMVRSHGGLQVTRRYLNCNRSHDDFKGQSDML